MCKGSLFRQGFACPACLWPTNRKYGGVQQDTTGKYIVAAACPTTGQCSDAFEIAAVSGFFPYSKVSHKRHGTFFRQNVGDDIRRRFLLITYFVAAAASI
jgi:hypothetical protein